MEAPGREEQGPGRVEPAREPMLIKRVRGAREARIALVLIKNLAVAAALRKRCVLYRPDPRRSWPGPQRGPQTSGAWRAVPNSRSGVERIEGELLGGLFWRELTSPDVGSVSTRFCACQAVWRLGGLGDLEGGLSGPGGPPKSLRLGRRQAPADGGFVEGSCFASRPVAPVDRLHGSLSGFFFFFAQRGRDCCGCCIPPRELALVRMPAVGGRVRRSTGHRPVLPAV